jgi:prepilin-type N-terminal cleavage/methylation domain-containing protein
MNDNKSIQGITLIELLVVIGIMGVIGGFVYPSISNWQTNKNIERDLQAFLSLVDYVTNKAKVVGGTGMIYCEVEDENTTIVSYKISRHYVKPNASNTFVIDASFTSNIIKDPRNAIGASPAEDPDHNILSGKSDFLSTICKNAGIINARGQSGLDGLSRDSDGIHTYIHAKGATAVLVRGTLTGDDEYQDHPSYYVKTSPMRGFSTVNRRDYNSGAWECAEDWWSDVQGDKNPCYL